MGERFTLSLRAYRWVAYAALVTLVLIVFSGAGVRLTGSGLGCPSWPDCSGTFVPELDTHVWIEYGNRLFSTVVGIACIAAGVLAYRVRPLRRDLLTPATVLAAGVVAQGLLGGLTVALHLSWQVVIAHYLLSMTLLVAGAVLVWRVRGATPNGSDRVLVLGTRVLVVYGAVVIVAGTFATAAGPHAGGAGTGDVVERLDAFGAETLRSLILLHGHMATAMGIVARAAVGRRPPPPRAAAAHAGADRGLPAARGPGRRRPDPVPQRAAGRARLGARLAARRAVDGAGLELGRGRLARHRARRPQRAPATVVMITSSATGCPPCWWSPAS